LQLELPGGTADLYLTAHLVQVLTLGNESLMNRTGKQGDAVPADLIAEVLASHADLWGAGGFQDFDIQVVPLLGGGGRGHRESGGHRTEADTSVLFTPRQ